MKPLKVKVLAGEQKAIERSFRGPNGTHGLAPISQTAGAGGALWIVAMPQPHLARAGRVGFFRGDGDTPKKSDVKSGVLEGGVGCKPRNMCVCHTWIVYMYYIYICLYIYIY